MYRVNSNEEWEIFENGGWKPHLDVENSIITMLFFKKGSYFRRAKFINTTPELCTNTKMFNLPYYHYVYDIREDCTDYTLDKSPAFLGTTDPINEPMVEGTVHHRRNLQTFSGMGTDNWYMEHKSYFMTKIRVFKDEERVSGLEVQFEAVNATGYPIVTHLYGRSSLNSDYSEINFGNLARN